MKLTVLNVAYTLAAVSFDSAGGAEQILASVDEALVQQGHNSLVVAMEGSRVCGELVPTPAQLSAFSPTLHRQAIEAQRRAIASVLRSRRVDVIHLHGVDFHEYLGEAGPPALATLHLPPAWYPREIWQSSRPRTYFNCVSVTQAATCPPAPHLVGVVPNGVNLQRLRFVSAKRNFALLLGRICPEKGFHFALDAARTAQIPLLLGGAVFPYREHQEYFERQIVPRLDSLRRYVGPLDFKRKAHLLAIARCLIVPSLAPETSSLVAMEAMASGTPIIAYKAGALQEIVRHGVTGYLVDGQAEIVEAIHLADRINPAACRHEAEQRFSSEVMVEKYFALYHAMVQGKLAERRNEYEPSIGYPPRAVDTRAQLA